MITPAAMLEEARFLILTITPLECTDLKARCDGFPSDPLSGSWEIREIVLIKGKTNVFH